MITVDGQSASTTGQAPTIAFMSLFPPLNPLTKSHQTPQNLPEATNAIGNYADVTNPNVVTNKIRKAKIDVDLIFMKKVDIVDGISMIK